MADATAAIFFRRDGFDTRGARLLGRQAAGEGFLKALLQHGASPNVYCYTPTRPAFDDFCALARGFARGPRHVQWIPETTPAALSTVGVLYRGDCVVDPLLWQRRHLDPRAYAVCGVTHTIASQATQRAISELLIAPAEPWDALICTSRSVRGAVDRIHAGYAAYLEQRVGKRPTLEMLLPIIPLGVDLDRIARGAAAPEARARMRAELGIGEDEVAVLYVGRFVFYAKAHPVPMYLALERAAQRAGKKVVLVQVGWFESAQEEAEFKAAAAALCTVVRPLFLDGRRPDVQRDVWSASDVFVSLSDNIQESFGLTPIEAMGAGLPVVVSDWDGYRESVRDGVDGICVPTIGPPPGVFGELASAYGAETIPYGEYVGDATMATAVDVAACEEAFVRLLESPELRRRLGDSGRRHVEETYDWRVVIRSYEALWAEQNAIRTASREARYATRAPTPPSPRLDDPFRVFGDFATHTLAEGDRLVLGPTTSLERVASIKSLRLTTFGLELRAPAELVAGLLTEVQARGGVRVGDVLGRHPPEARAMWLRTLLYLLKVDVLRWQREPVGPS
jgi:glycosyltransferase involved in cell wall biosynthesis